MLKAHSPLGENANAVFDGVALSEKPIGTLSQISGRKAQLKKDLGVLPEFGKVLDFEGRKLLRLTETQVWVLGEAPNCTSTFATPLSSSRTCLTIEGEKSRALLAACAAIDFAPAQFPVGKFVATGIHHTPVLIHCIAENGFHVYAMRTFALSLWQWLTDAAVGLK